jgi:hypothetical protein
MTKNNKFESDYLSHITSSLSSCIFIVAICLFFAGKSYAVSRISGATIQFSHEAGFYAEPFNLQMTSSDTNCNISYTIDGSNPVTSSTKIKSGSSVTIRIDPDNTTGRGKTPGFVVRACLEKTGYTSTFPVSRTFIFLEKVKTQTKPGGTWPSSAVNGQVLDYSMASDVVNDSRYKSQITSALLEIPTISISSDPDKFFGATTGIYVNSNKKWDDGWERDCSVELIYTNKAKGFQVNAGIKIRGGNSAHDSSNPKHGFRLFFREEYGAKKLEYPLCGKEGASEFDCIDLRCEQNYSWSMDGSTHNLMIKDIFCRDLQGQMGQPYAKGNKYHLYINGVYWGIYETDERPEASFAESYLGGDKEDYDVIKVNSQTWPYYNEATDGTMASWENLWNLCQIGFETNQQYFALEGKDSNGNRVKDATVLVDIDNLIDYMLVIFYSGNFDAPVSAWYSDDMPNNFFAIYNRNNKSMGYKFVAHDSEHCMFTEKVNGISQGLYEDRVSIGRSGKMVITNVLDFNPQWLHYKLSSNAEYRTRFADRASKYLSYGGVLSPEKAKALFMIRAQEIDTAIIAESARWGDAQSYKSLNKIDNWLPELEKMYNKFFPLRTNIVKKQLLDEDLYSAYQAPYTSVSEKQLSDEIQYITEPVTVNLADSNSMLSAIFYTLDGSDPRLIGGGISKKAIKGKTTASVNISSTTLLSARSKVGAGWSPLKQVWFMQENEDYSHLKVTELSYHPLDIISGTDTTEGSDLEFIEFLNTGQVNLDLSGLTLDSAVHYTFPDKTILASHAFYVIASKPNKFYSKYGVYPSGNYQGNFSNGGEYVLLNDRNGNKIMSFTYSDDSPWPKTADGKGYTLNSVEKDPSGNPDDYSYWTSSSKQWGTPFTYDDGTVDIEDISFNTGIEIYPNPASEYIKVHFGTSEEEFSLSIIDLNGRILSRSKVHNDETIQLSELHLNPGVYIIKAQDGTQSETCKLIYK